MSGLKTVSWPWTPSTVLLMLMWPGHLAAAFTSLSCTALWSNCLAACTPQWLSTYGIVSKTSPHLRHLLSTPVRHCFDGIEGKDSEERLVDKAPVAEAGEATSPQEVVRDPILPGDFEDLALVGFGKERPRM